MNPLYGITNEQAMLIRTVDSLRIPLNQILILSPKKESLQTQLSYQKHYLNKLKNNKKFFSIVLPGTILFYVPVYILCFIVIYCYTTCFPDSTLNQTINQIAYVSVKQALLYIGIIAAPFSIMCGFILLLFNKLKRKAEIEITSKFVLALESDLADANKQLYDAALSIKDTLLVIPPDYQYSHAVEYIYSCLRNQRASTIGQAVNLYEDQLHKWKMENYASELVNIQQQQQATLNQIRGLGILNAASNVAGFFV